MSAWSKTDDAGHEWECQAENGTQCQSVCLAPHTGKKTLNCKLSKNRAKAISLDLGSTWYVELLMREMCSHLP